IGAPQGSNLASTTLTNVSTDTAASLSVVLETAPPPPPPPAVVSGVLRTTSGVPLPGWTVQMGATTMTGPDGSYSLSVPSGQQQPLFVYEGTNLFSRRLLLVSTPGTFATDRVLDITIPTVMINVTVTDTTGAPVVGAQLSAHQGSVPSQIETVPTE